MADNPDDFPGVARAYDFVLPSYQWIVSRCESAEGRLTTLFTIAATVMLGIPVFAKNVRPDITFQSPWFMLTVALLAAAGATGIIGRLRGKLVLPSPQVLFDSALNESEWEFRKNAVYFAGQHFEKNKRVIDLKHRMAVIAGALLLAASVSAITWLMLP